MPIARVAIPALLVAAATASAYTQAPSPAGPTYEVVSIKRNVGPIGSTVNQRPDGGFTMRNVTVAVFISRAYPFAGPTDIVGLPAWATSEGYDVSTTSSLSSPTLDQRIAMLRAMLADRFKLAVHIESRDQPVYDLVLARGDRRLGSGIKPLDIDCARLAAERAASPPSPGPPDVKLPPPPCTLRVVTAFLRDRAGDKQGARGDLLEGDTTMANLAEALRQPAGRPVVNKTGLSGFYRVAMNFDSAFNRRGLDVVASPDAPPSVFTAIQEQLGLKLESSGAPRDTLIVDRLERPTED